MLPYDAQYRERGPLGYCHLKYLCMVKEHSQVECTGRVHDSRLRGRWFEPLSRKHPNMTEKLWMGTYSINRHFTNSLNALCAEILI